MLKVRFSEILAWLIGWFKVEGKSISQKSRQASFKSDSSLNIALKLL